MGDPRTTIPKPNRWSVRADEFAVTVLFSPDRAAVGGVRRVTAKGLRLGRDPGQPGLSCDDPLASRLHATINWDQQREAFLLCDEKSRNGTRLDGVEIERELLAVGSVFRVGDSVLQFERLEMDLDGWQAPPESKLQGRSIELFRSLEEIARVAPTDLSVLILGATGTGKECVARQIHQQSGRSGPFVPVNCAAIPANLVESELFGHRKGAFSGATEDRSGLLQEAAGGTVLMDEVGELPGASQAKLLRVLEDRCVRPVGATDTEQLDVRFLFATNRDLAAATKEGNFRGDLYARINQWQIRMPPLRQRLEDMPPIIDRLIVEHGAEQAYELSGDAAEALALYDWPFNVRELVSAIRKAIVLLPTGGLIEPKHLPPELTTLAGSGPAQHPIAADSEPLPPPGTIPTAKELERLLRHFRGKVAEVARYTDRDRPQVYRWMRRFGLEPDTYRRRR